MSQVVFTPAPEYRRTRRSSATTSNDTGVYFRRVCTAILAFVGTYIQIETIVGSIISSSRRITKSNSTTRFLVCYCPLSNQVVCSDCWIGSECLEKFLGKDFNCSSSTSTSSCLNTKSGLPPHNLGSYLISFQTSKKVTFLCCTFVRLFVGVQAIIFTFDIESCLTSRSRVSFIACFLLKSVEVKIIKKPERSDRTVVFYNIKLIWIVNNHPKLLCIRDRSTRFVRYSNTSRAVAIHQIAYISSLIDDFDFLTTVCSKTTECGILIWIGFWLSRRAKCITNEESSSLYTSSVVIDVSNLDATTL